MLSEFDDYPADLKSAIERIVSEQQIIGYFSVNRHKNYLSGSSALKYFKDPNTSKVNFDLNENFQTTARDDLSDNLDRRVDYLLEWIKLNYKIIEAPGYDSWIEPKFVSSAGLLGKVMLTSCNSKASYAVIAAKWKGTIYLCRNDTEPEMSEMHKKFSYYAMKFKDYLRSDAPDNLPNASNPVEDNAEFRYVSRSRIGDHSVLICGPLDGLNSKKKIVNPLELNDHGFVKFKISRNLGSTEWERQKFEKFKLALWWTQCFFVNNPKVVCGFQNRDGIVDRLETFSLPKMVRESQGTWDPVRCVQECRDFLDLVAENVVDDRDKTIYEFKKEAGSAGPVIKKLSPESKPGFLPPSYLAASV